MEPISRGADYVEMARRKGRTESPLACPPHQSFATHLPSGRPVPGARPPIRAADTTARHQLILGARIHFALIAWRARLPPASGRLAGGSGGSAITARTGCQPHSGPPPAPFRERAYALGPGFCCVCGQPVYRFGWHVNLWDTGTNKHAVWHSACVIAWQFWTAPSDYAQLLRRLQARRCGETGGRLWKSAEVDHRIPLFRVWSDYRDARWPALLDYWGLPNLQVINRDVHIAKCATEAQHRRTARYLASPERVSDA